MVVDLIEVLKRLLFNSNKRYLVGEAETKQSSSATIIYDDLNGSPTEGKTFVIPDGNIPPPPPPPEDKIVVSIEYSPAVVQVGSVVNLNGSKTTASGSNGSIIAWKWTVRNEGGMEYPVTNPNTPFAAFVTPDLNWVNVILDVVDNNGKFGTRTIKINISTGPPPPPPPPPTGCLPSECKDPVTKQCRPIGPNETVDPTTGECKPIVIPPPPPPPPPPGEEKKLAPTLVTASGQDSGKEANLVVDGNYETRWSADGDGQFIEFTFDTNYRITKVALTGYWYDRTYTFEINGKRFESLAGRAPNTLIEYDLKDLNIDTNKVKIIGHGNSISTYNSYREIQFYGIPSGTIPPPPPPPPPPDCPPGQHRDPITGQCVPDTGPPPPTGDLTARIIGFGDNDTTSGADQVLTAIMKVPDVTEYDFVGDGPYSESGTQWVSMMKKYFDVEKVKKLRISQGNHEHPESESQETEDDIEEWIPSLNKSPEGRDWTSAGQVGNVYVISGNTQDMDVEFKRDQYDWLVAELNTAKALRAAGQIDWIVYLAHKPFFTLKSSHSPYTAVRFLYKDIFRDAQVDFVLHGHNHNTQLWKPMIPNQSEANGEGEQLFTLMPDGKTYDFSKDHGWLGIVTGHAGHEWNPINDSGSGVQNVLHYRDSGKFGFTQLDFKGKTANVKSIDSDGKIHFEYNVSRQGDSGPPPPPPGDDPVAKLSAPSQVAVGSTVLLDGSQSVADTLVITQTLGETVNLVDAGTFKKSFTAPMSAPSNFQLGFQAVATKGTKQSITQVAIQVFTVPPPPPPPPPDGEVLWDSNIHLKTGTKYTINDTHGDQSPNSKGVWMAASGNPRLIVDADGTFHLEADSGHGRVYIRATNYNARIEGECMFEDNAIRNTTWRLRCRHNEGGDCPNRFGGFGATCEREEQLAEYATESCHNNHENTVKKPLAKDLEVGKWFKFKYSCCNNAANTQVLFKTEYDYLDGNGFVTVLEGKHSSPQAFYMDEAKFMQESYAWLRVNNESTGSIAYKNVRIIKLKSGDLG